MGCAQVTHRDDERDKTWRVTTSWRVEHLYLRFLMKYGFAKPQPLPVEPQLSHKETLVSLLTVETALVALVVLLLTWVLLVRYRKGFRPTNLSVGLLKLDSKGAQAAKKTGGWPEYTLLAKKKLSRDTMCLTFSMPDTGGVTKLAAGKHIMCRAMVNEERVVRPYTPTLIDAGNRNLDLVVKAYDQAKMSSHLHFLPVGGKCEMFGPVGSLKYSAGSFDRLVFLCAGTGITPVYAMCKSVLNDPQEQATQIVVLYQSRFEEDVLLRDELLVLAAQARKKGRSFTLVFACSRAGPDFVEKATSDSASAAAEAAVTNALSSGGAAAAGGGVFFGGGGSGSGGVGWGGGGGSSSLAEASPLCIHIAGYLDEAVVAPYLPLVVSGISSISTSSEAHSAGSGSGQGVVLPRTKVFLCGPGGFNSGVTQICEARGYGGDDEDAKSRLHIF